MAKWVYLFDEFDKAEKHAEGRKGMRGLLGGKGEWLAEMTRIGVPVSPGFTVTTEACNEYISSGGKFPKDLWNQILKALSQVKKDLDREFGDPKNPLLVSVRSGAPISMPGVMDTVLNLGLNDETIKGLIKQTSDERFAYDAYRRFILMFSDTVLSGDEGADVYRPGLKRHAFEEIFDEVKEAKGVKEDTEVDADGLKKVVAESKEHFKKEYGEEFPADPREQLRLAINAVFKSWNNPRAKAFRSIKGIPDDLGTGVNVQTMVFGNMGDDSGTGVAFTRNPITGEKVLYGNYLDNSQGEDVVSSIRPPKSISQLREEIPEVYNQLELLGHKLERYYQDVQDLEFVIERGMLWLLQTRAARPTATGRANLRFAIDFLDENLISEREAIFWVKPYDLEQILVLKLPPHLDKQPIVCGVDASPGATSGIAVFDADTAESLGSAGKKVVLIRHDLTPDDIHGVNSAQGIISSRESSTSHAALICRGMGKPCVASETIQIDYAQKLFSVSGKVVREGDVITIDGTSGTVYIGEIPLVKVNIQDAPCLMRYASLVYDVNPDDYVEDGVGTLWQLRDAIRDKSVPRFPGHTSQLSESSTESTISKIDDERYVSFIQPPDVVILDVLNTMHRDYDSDTEIVAWGIMDNLMRLLHNEVGIGNHHFAIRPLTDPERSFINREVQSVVLNSSESPYQFIGIEFFAINRFLRNYLPWGCVQWWGLVELWEPTQFWRLDKINPQGESLVTGECDLVGFTVTLNGKCLTTMETREFYNELRKREYGWNWYKENNTSWREIVGTLQRVQTGQPTNQNMLTKCQAVGLLTQDFQLSSVGYSLLCEQTAAGRRHITFAGRELQDE